MKLIVGKEYNVLDLTKLPAAPKEQLILQYLFRKLPVNELASDVRGADSEEDAHDYIWAFVGKVVLAMDTIFEQEKTGSCRMLENGQLLSEAVSEAFHSGVSARVIE